MLDKKYRTCNKFLLVVEACYNLIKVRHEKYSREMC